MPGKADELDSLYDKDPATGKYIIMVAIDKYADIFNDWDPAPFKKRDLDRDLERFLSDCSSEIPLKRGIVIEFQAPAAIRDTEKEERTRAALKNHFSYEAHSLRRKIARSREQSGLYALVSFGLLFAAVFLSTILAQNFIYITLIEALYIGGWVFLWEAISTISFKNRGVVHQHKEYRRFQQAPIRFRYVPEGTSGQQAIPPAGGHSDAEAGSRRVRQRESR